ncbi:MAG TPA: hydroxymethylbilane synthase [Phycisphaerales bacterium]|nr:hydroxymethylbilane synthase [Phycisphaerales bacterium]
MRTIRIATRASKLALTQSNYVADLIRGVSGEVEVELVRISTKGDRDKSEFLYKGSSVGYFTSEVENALLDGRGDVAVHSLKDLPTAITEGLVVAAIPTRESVADVIVAGDSVKSVADLAAGATVGTSSLRRIAQLQHMRNDLKSVPLRGNVETRVGKVASGEVDAIIIAHAGLNRLGLSDNISVVLSPDEFVPAPAQGALAIQTRSDDSEILKIISQLDDAEARLTAETERHILAAMHGGCSIPLGAYSHIDGDVMTICAVISDPEGERYIKRVESCPVSEAKATAEKLVEQLFEAGAQQILDGIRKEG